MELIKFNKLECNEDQINNYTNKIYIYLILFLFGLITFFNINYFPKNFIDKSQIKLYIKYIN
jgi:hypothetical protein